MKPEKINKYNKLEFIDQKGFRFTKIGMHSSIIWNELYTGMMAFGAGKSLVIRQQMDIKPINNCYHYRIFTYNE